MANAIFQHANLLPGDLSGTVSGWAQRLADLLVPYVDQLDQLPDRARTVFHYDAGAALSSPENAEVFSSEKTPAVTEAFVKGQATNPAHAGTLQDFMDEIKAETGPRAKTCSIPSG